MKPQAIVESLMRLERRFQKPNVWIWPPKFPNVIQSSKFGLGTQTLRQALGVCTGWLG
ncbi:hypothetical protein HanPI659440_Chr15g0610621 [Helianthus annuus]|nr:hypothetical protein HanPI659440_Chr15g0610621 [Helianthus annuus]